MENKNYYKTPAAVKVATLTFVITGLIFVGIAYLFIGLYFNNKNYIETEAIITYVDHNDEDVNIRFTTKDGEDIETSVNFYSSSFKEGKKVTISYNIDNPTKVKYKPVYIILPIVFGSIGLILLIIGLVVTLKIYMIARNREVCMLNGRKTNATVLSIKTNYALSIGGVHPQKIYYKEKSGRTSYTTSYSKHLIDFKENLEICVYIIDSSGKSYADPYSIHDKDENNYYDADKF